MDKATKTLESNINTLVDHIVETSKQESVRAVEIKNDLMNSVIMISVCITVITIILSVISALTITRPINTFSKLMTSLANGNSDINVPYQTSQLKLVVCRRA